MIRDMRLYQRPHGVWYVEIDRNERRSLRTKNKDIAQRRFIKIRRQYLEGKLVQLTGATGKTLSQYTREYLAWAQKVQPRRTFEMNRLGLRMLAQYAGAATRLDRINRRHVDQLVADQLRGKSPATVNNYIRHARAALNKAVEWGYLRVNPLAEVKELPQDLRQPRFLPMEALTAFLAALGDIRRRCLALAYLSTGRRASEILSLRWQDINLAEGRYWLQKSKRGRGEWFPISSLFRLALETMGPKQIGPVFPWRSRNTAYKIIKAALAKTGHPDLTLHDLRHTFASWQVMQGRDLRTVQRLLGHTSYRMTEKYAHLSPSHLQAAVEIEIGPVDLGGPEYGNAHKMRTAQKGTRLTC